MIMGACPGLALLVVLAFPSPSHAIWLRWEIVGGAAGYRFLEGKAIGLTLYNQRYGVGIGSYLYEVKKHGWDIGRVGLSDASGHLLDSFGPVNIRLALKSYEGLPLVTGPLRELRADHTINRLEAYLDYSGWGHLSNFSEARLNEQSELARFDVEGRLPVRYFNYGLRLDCGSTLGVSVGRLDFKTQAVGQYQSRSSGQWYGLVHLFLGATLGDSIGGNVSYIVRDGWDALSSLLGRRSYIRETIRGKRRPVNLK